MTAEQKLRELEQSGKLTPKQTILSVCFGSSSEIAIFNGLYGKETRHRLRIKLDKQKLTAIPVNEIWGLEVISLQDIERLLKKVREIADSSDNITSVEKRLKLTLEVRSLTSRFPLVPLLDLPK